MYKYKYKSVCRPVMRSGSYPIMYHEEEATCAQGNDLQPPAGRRFNTNTSMDTNTKANTDDID